MNIGKNVSLIKKIGVLLDFLLNIDFMVHISWIIFSMVFMGKEEMKERNILYMVNCWN